VLDRFEDLMAVVDERMIVRPDFWMISMPGSWPCEWMAMSRPPGPSARAKRRDHALGLELERGARAIGLRGDDEIVIGERAAGLWDDRVEQEAVILAIDDEHHRPLVDRVAGARADAGFPVLRQERFEIDDLLSKRCAELPISGSSCHTSSTPR
jgi:hypothetical protein